MGTTKLAKMDSDLDRLIERRSRQFGAEEATAFQRSLTRKEIERREDQAALTRVLWQHYHQHLAEVHHTLAAEHEQKAERLKER